MVAKESKKNTMPPSQNKSSVSVSITPPNTKKFKEPTLFNIGLSGMKIIDAFKGHLEANSKAKTTVKSYIFDIKSLIEFIEVSEKQEFIGCFSEQQYKNYINTQIEMNLKIATLNKRINSIASFNNYLIHEKLMTVHIADLKTDKMLHPQSEFNTSENNPSFPQKLVKII